MVFLIRSRVSANELHSGASGPTITKSIDFSRQYFVIVMLSVISNSTFSAIIAVPALPGLQNIFPTLFDLFSPKQSACSLPPPPITKTLLLPMEES